MKRIENQNKMATKRKVSSDSVKHASLTGYSEEITSLILTKMKQHPYLGDWHRDKKIRIPYHIKHALLLGLVQMKVFHIHF